MASIIASPTRYIQGKGVLEQLCGYAGRLGDRLFLLTSASGRGRVETLVAKGQAEANCTVIYETFNGECSQQEIDRVQKACQDAGCNVIVGIGGGKTHDTAKAAAYQAGCPVVIVPTIASTDAPCSALSVIYTQDGVFERYLFLPSSPNMVLVDTDIVSAAPARLLVSGMGDALATYFEAKACRISGATNCVGGKTTLAAMQLAKLCYDTLMADGIKAAIAMKAHACTKAVENIIEANTYLSGIGFESGGLAAAHAIHNGLTAIPAAHSCYHGEKVAFGTLVQLVLENASEEQITEVLEFCTAVGLPVTLKELHAEGASEEQLMAVAKLACAEGETIWNMPGEISWQAVYAAILAADAMGKAYLADE